MLLFINVFITNLRHGSQRAKRPQLLLDDRLTVFKYQLASLSVIEWDKVVIYCLLGDEYHPRAKELRGWIDEVFKCPVEFQPRRCIHQKDWQAACKKNVFGASSDGLIWFLGNDDHVFIGRDLAIINEGKALLQKETGPASLAFSHWPEHIRFFAGRNAERIGNYVITTRDEPDAIQIVNESLLRSWWFGMDYGDSEMRRSDDIMAVSKGRYKEFPFKCHLPLVEQGYHMEGYNHVQIPFSLCPVWKIPPGFFENQIRIAYCPQSKQDGWVNLDPRKSFDDTDYRLRMEDIPLFWRSRIAQSVDFGHVDKDVLNQSRFQFLKEMTGCRPQSGWAAESDSDPPNDWLII